MGDRMSVRYCSGAPPSGGNPQSRSRGSGERRYEELIGHYGIRAATPASRMTGLAQENGAIESPHGHLKRALAGPITASSTRWWGDEARPEPSAEPSLLAEPSHGS